MSMPGRRVRVAVVFGGRSTEHAISCVSARAASWRRSTRPSTRWCRSGSRPRAPGCSPPGDPEALRISGRELPAVRDRHGGGAARRPDRRRPGRGRPGRGGPGAARGGRGLPGAARPVRRGRHDPGPAGDGRRAVRGLGRARLARPRWTRSSPRSCWPPRACRWGRTRCSGPAAAPAEADRERLGLPVFVKPARAGSSFGISRVDDWADLRRRDRDGPGHRPQGAGRGGGAGAGDRVRRAGGTGRRRRRTSACRRRSCVTGGHEFYDFEAKYLDDVSDLDIPADLPADVTARCGSSPRGRSPRWTAPAWPGSTSSSAPAGRSRSTR